MSAISLGSGGGVNLSGAGTARALNKTGVDANGGQRRRLLPSFLIIGPPRTGTSWLYEVLRGHLLLTRPTKETRFFDVHFHRGVNWYLRHFPRLSHSQHVGEVAPTYFASPDARQRIHQTIPEAKFICIFRHPVERIVSLYRLKRAYGMIPWSLEQALLRDPELKASGMYATNLKQWRNTFGQDRVLATVYDDLRDRPQPYMDALLQFIGAPGLRLNEKEIQRIHASQTMTQPRNYGWTRRAIRMSEWCKAHGLSSFVSSVKRSPLRKAVLGGGPAFSELSIEASRKICELFRSEIDELEAMLNRDFSSWKSVET